MRSKFTRLATSLLSLTGAAALFCGFNTTAHAQFQTVAGGGGEDAAQGGIIAYNEEATIAVGHSSSFGNDQDVYVVVTDICGNVRWARTYDFGGADIGRKIRYNKNHDAFVIVGSTENLNNCCTQNDAFLMEIDRDGNVNWARTYGGVSDDQGNDVRVGRDEDVYYFAGQTASFGQGRYDAWLGGVNAGDGSIIWSRVYGGRGSDGFNALDLGCGDGTLVAAGYTYNNTDDGSSDILVAKTDLGGNIVGPFGMRHYGGDGDQAANSVINYYNKLCYVAGYTTGIGNSTLAYAMGIDCETGDPAVDKAFGNPKDGSDNRFTEIQLAADGKNLALTGYAQHYVFGEYDVLLAELNTKLDRVGLGFVFYGAERDDQGWSVMTARGFDGDNYVIAGFTDNFGVFGERDLYEIRTDSKGDSRCNWKPADIWETRPGYKPYSFRTPSPLVLVHCNARPEVRENKEGKILCSVCYDGKEQELGGGEELSDNLKSDAATVTAAVAPVSTK